MKMSMFLCDSCGNFADADDGCTTSHKNPDSLICIDCMELQDESEPITYSLGFQVEDTE